MMPRKGTCAALAARASSTVSPTYQSFRPGFLCWIISNPSGAGFGLLTCSAQMIGSNVSSGAKRSSVMSSSYLQPPGEDRQAEAAAQPV